jgi:succinate dehydrogenase/fumarate reductase-like Fe-S protein
LDPRPPRPIARHSLFLHQRQRLQGMHDGACGETVYACTARLRPREVVLAPLSNKRLVRDLVTEIAPPAERFG